MFWAKLTPDRTAYHPLIAHSADVAAVADVLLRPGGPLAERLAHAAGAPCFKEPDRAALVFLAALHDLGKVNHGFQARINPHAPPIGHVRVVLESLTLWEFRDKLLTALLPLALPNGVALDVLKTIVCHHGRPWLGRANERWLPHWRPAHGRAPLEELARLARVAMGWSRLDAYERTPSPVLLAPRSSHYFAGLLTLADWIASTPEAFPFCPSADADPDGYWEVAQERAVRACVLIGVVPRATTISLAGCDLLAHLFPHVFPKATPTVLQRHIAEMPLPAPGTRLLVESETGSGKTEAALTLYARLRAAGRVDGLMFALPTRATASAMYDRVQQMLPHLHPDGPMPVVALAVGGAIADASSATAASTPASTPDNAEASVLELPDRAQDVGLEPDERDLVHWASSNSKKRFAAEVVVGTVDQVMLAAMPVKHAHLRLAALGRHLIVVDELHAYDRYMAAILSRALEMHVQAGGLVLVMSATLAATARACFGGPGAAVPDRARAEATPYPVLATWRPADHAWRDIALAPAAPRQRQTSWRTSGEDDALAWAVAQAQAGRRVCVLRNTVRGAKATLEWLTQHEAEALLWRPDGSTVAVAYHARYDRADRVTLDRQVLRDFGRGSAGRGQILVATQVVEQSLDMDFDAMVTDLCPIDVLLQRLGRLWRHPERPRPEGCLRAEMVVIAPEGGFEQFLECGRGPRGSGWGTVYPNLADLELTRRMIDGHPVIEIPRQNRFLVEAVYHDEARRVLATDAWRRYLTDVDGQLLGQETAGRQARLDFTESYAASARRFHAAAEVSLRTRLGDDQVVVRLPNAVRAWYASGAVVTKVAIPADVLRSADLSLEKVPTPTFAAEATVPTWRWPGLVIRYTPTGWEWEAATTRNPRHAR